MTSPLDRRILLILAGLVLLLGIVILAGNFMGLSAPDLMPVSREIGVAGPIRLAFKEEMDRNSVETRFKILPQVSGRFTWSAMAESGGYILSFWPDHAFTPGQEISIELGAGAAGQSGLKLRKSILWKINVRQAEILFLSPVNRPEIWRVARAGQAPVQLTFTDGNVFDFQASPDGETILYSVRNVDNGVDLWEIRRDGGQPNLLLPCASDWCIEPAVSPDGALIAYSRRRSGALPGAGAGLPQLWLLYRSTMETEVLYADPNIGGSGPTWSPDGQFLAFFDAISNGVRGLNIQTKQDFLLPSQTGTTGRWSPDSQSLLFTDNGETDAGPYIGVFQVDVAAQKITRVLGEDQSPMDYSMPDWAPDGSQVAVGIRRMNAGPDKQIVIMDLDGTHIREVTTDHLYTNASYHWDPSGQFIIFQRLMLNSSDQRPEIILWEKTSGAQTPVAQDAFLPGWLP